MIVLPRHFPSLPNRDAHELARHINAMISTGIMDHRQALMYAAQLERGAADTSPDAEHSAEHASPDVQG